MKIPKKFKIGRKVYKVLEPRRIVGPPGCYGECTPTVQQLAVAIAHPRTNNVRTDKARFQTFWHETTHAMLHDMGSRKYKDEVFVDALAKRIANVLNTVVF